MNKRGRPPSGILKVPYYRRVVPEMVPILDSVLDGTLKVAGSGDLQWNEWEWKDLSVTSICAENKNVAYYIKQIEDKLRVYEG